AEHPRRPFRRPDRPLAVEGLAPRRPLSLRPEPSLMRCRGLQRALRKSASSHQERVMNESPVSKTVTPAITAHLAADLIADGEQMPVYVWTIDHPAGRVLVDTGMIDSRPEVGEMSRH